MVNRAQYNGFDDPARVSILLPANIPDNDPAPFTTNSDQYFDYGILWMGNGYPNPEVLGALPSVTIDWYLSSAPCIGNSNAQECGSTDLPCLFFYFSDHYPVYMAIGGA
jgi:hypothetical protein